MTSPYRSLMFGDQKQNQLGSGLFQLPQLAQPSIGGELDMGGYDTGTLDFLTDNANTGAPYNPGGGNQGMMSAFSQMLKNSGFLGSTDEKGIRSDGWGGAALGTLQGLGSAYLGLKQYGIAKDTLNENKRQFGLNYEAQKTTTNAQMEDRQRARNASSGSGAYQSVGDYMNKHGVR